MNTHYSVYKKSAAFQLKFIEPKQGENPFDVTEGFVMVEFANAAGDNKGKYRVYNWKEKISMKLGSRDIAMMLVDAKKSDGAKITHDPKAGTDQAKKLFKTLTIKKGQKAGTFFWSISFNGTVSVPVDKYEHVIISELLKTAIARIYGWT